MKSSLTKLAGLQRRLEVEVPPEIVAAALDKMYKEVQKVAKFKGFRPGKAPITLVKTEYKSRVESDVLRDVIQDHYTKALHEHSLNPVNYPEIEFDQLQEGSPFKFIATFEVRPDVQLKQYEGLEVEKEVLTLDDKSVDGILEDIRKSKAKLQPMLELRPVQMGDVAIIDFKGFMHGSALPNGAGEEYALELGANQFIPGFEEGIVGMQPGQSKTIQLKFPDDYNPKDLAGQPVEFRVTLKEIKRKVLPELDDEFAQSVGDHKTLAELKDEIRKDMRAQEEKRIKDDLRTRILEELVNKNPLDVPKSMVAEQKEVIIEDIHHKMERQGMNHDDFEKYKEKWDGDFIKSAEFVIRSSLLVNSIAQKENLFPTEQDVEEKIANYAKQTGIELEKIKAFYDKPENNSRLRFQMTEDRVMDLLIQKAQIKEVPKDKLKSESSD